MEKELIDYQKRAAALSDWYRLLKKAEKRLEDSKKCYELYGDDDSKLWMIEDAARVEEIRQKIQKVKAYFDDHNI